MIHVHPQAQITAPMCPVGRTWQESCGGEDFACVHCFTPSLTSSRFYNHLAKRLVPATNLTARSLPLRNLIGLSAMFV
jgi:hypothetical protein